MGAGFDFSEKALGKAITDPLTPWKDDGWQQALAPNYNWDDPEKASNEPERVRAEILQREMDRFDATYAPVEQAALKDINSTAYMEQALSNVNIEDFLGNSAKSEEMAKGLGRATSVAQRAQSKYDAQLDFATTKTKNDSDARINQVTRNDAYRDMMINIGRNISTESKDGLDAAANAQNKRDAQHRVAKAEADAANTQTAATIGAAALIAFA